ncbi:cob(I)yrinic acid a,c-diamide adenosyltransferase, partial [bacterium]|nr:cob(I)yrinic acid a,c-diamide adenosyltransferase [bacterium]
TVRIYAGEAESGSAATFGLAMRRRGGGGRVAVVRFLKTGASGEIGSAKDLGIEVFSYGTDIPSAEDRGLVGEGWRMALDLILAGKYDLLILDGLLNVLDTDSSLPGEVGGLLDRRPSLELVLTGRTAPVELVKRADVVVEMLDIKH